MERAAPDYESAYINDDRASEQDIAALIAWLSSQPGSAKLTVVTPGANDLEYSKAAAALVKSGARHSSYKSLQNAAHVVDDRILVLWPDLAILDRVESMDPAAIAVATSGLDSIAIWTAARRPLDLHAGVHADGFRLPPQVEQGLHYMVNAVNIGNGLNSSERGRALGILEVLVDHGAEWVDSQMGAYVANHGWSLRHAAELVDLCVQYRAGHRFRNVVHYQPGTWDRWVERGEAMRAELERQQSNPD